MFVKRLNDNILNYITNKILLEYGFSIFILNILSVAFIENASFNINKKCQK